MINDITKEVKFTNFYIEKAKKEDGYTFALERDGQKIYALSKYKPKEQAISLLGEEFGNEQTIWILFGFNMGYGVNELLQRVGEQIRIIVIEPNEVLLKQQMEIIKEERLSNRDNITFFTGHHFNLLQQILNEHISAYDFNNFKIKSSEIYFKYYNSYFAEVTRILNEIINARVFNFNTIAYYRMKWMQNIIRNRDRIYSSCDLSVHGNKYPNIPAVIVSAGPSLKKNIHKLKDFKGIIFAIGRTLTPLLELGISPDFVVSVDPTDIIYETFGKDKLFSIPLITLAQGNSKVVEGSQGEIYFMHNSPELLGLLDIQVNPTLAVSGSVATLCLSLAKYMSCDPIIFVGQDLAYTNDEKHSNLAIMDTETANNKIHTNEGLKFVKSYTGGKVASDDLLISFIRWFETFIEEHKECKYINATEGGAYIEGAQHMSLSEAIEQYCREIEKPIIEHRRLERNKIDIDSNLKKTLDDLRKIKEYIQDIKEYYHQLLFLNTQKNKYKIFTLIKEKESKMLEYKRGNAILKMLMEDISYAIASSNTSKMPIQETEEEKQKRKLRLNYETYECLLVESEKVIRLIEKEI